MRKILSIDGGGIKGVFPAAFLAKLEEELPEPIGHYFDLIAGTSTGGIIALALGAGYTAREILEFYETYGPEIFPRKGLLTKAKHWLGGKHAAHSLAAALEAQFGNRKLGDSLTRLVIPSQNLETGKVYIFKTAHHPRFQEDKKRNMVDVALATSAAPTYFPTHKLPGGTALIDGGIWANDPAGVAAVEAVGILKWDAQDVQMLSLSCTASPIKMSLAHKWSLGKLYWASKLLEVVSAGQSSGAQGTAAVLLGHERISRIAPNVAAGAFELDDVSSINRLKGLGESEAREARPKLEHFFRQLAPRFEPVVPGGTVACVQAENKTGEVPRFRTPPLEYFFK
ncbi:MAG: patatin-like phospholipase family protein [Rhizobium sp.]|nr:patatin-like phospholipase family protein [Rhizobium sp.]